MVVRDETYFERGIELHDSCTCGERGSALCHTCGQKPRKRKRNYTTVMRFTENHRRISMTVCAAR